MFLQRELQAENIAQIVFTGCKSKSIFTVQTRNISRARHARPSISEHVRPFLPYDLELVSRASLKLSSFHPVLKYSLLAWLQASKFYRSPAHRFNPCLRLPIYTKSIFFGGLFAKTNDIHFQLIIEINISIGCGNPFRTLLNSEYITQTADGVIVVYWGFFKNWLRFLQYDFLVCFCYLLQKIFVTANLQNSFSVGWGVRGSLWTAGSSCLVFGLFPGQKWHDFNDDFVHV